MKPGSRAAGLLGYESKTVTHRKSDSARHCSATNMSNAFSSLSFFSLLKIQVTSLSSYSILSKSHLKWCWDLSAFDHQSPNTSHCLSTHLPTYVLAPKAMFLEAWKRHSLSTKWTTHNNSFYFIWFSTPRSWLFPAHIHGSCLERGSQVAVNTGTKSAPSDGKWGETFKCKIPTGVAFTHVTPGALGYFSAPQATFWDFIPRSKWEINIFQRWGETPNYRTTFPNASDPSLCLPWTHHISQNWARQYYSTHEFLFLASCAILHSHWTSLGHKCLVCRTRRIQRHLPDLISPGLGNTNAVRTHHCLWTLSAGLGKAKLRFQTRTWRGNN